MHRMYLRRLTFTNRRKLFTEAGVHPFGLIKEFHILISHALLSYSGASARESGAKFHSFVKRLLWQGERFNGAGRESARMGEDTALESGERPVVA